MFLCGGRARVGSEGSAEAQNDYHSRGLALSSPTRPLEASAVPDLL